MLSGSKVSAFVFTGRRSGCHPERSKAEEEDKRVWEVKGVVAPACPLLRRARVCVPAAPTQAVPNIVTTPGSRPCGWEGLCREPHTPEQLSSHWIALGWERGRGGAEWVRGCDRAGVDRSGLGGGRIGSISACCKSASFWGPVCQHRPAQTSTSNFTSARPVPPKLVGAFPRGKGRMSPDLEQRSTVQNSPAGRGRSCAGAAVSVQRN